MIEFTATHTINTQGGYNIQTIMDQLFTSTNGTNFKHAKLLDGTFTHVGIGCSCSKVANQALCGFVFA